MKRIVLLIETSRAYGRQLITGIARYSRLHEPWSFYKEPIHLKSSIPHLTSWKPDGIILRDSLINKELVKLKIPTILAVHDSSYPKNVPVIKTDSRSIAKMASEHFLEKGLRNFAFCGFDNYDWSNERKMFFCKFNSDAGYKTNIYIPPKRNRNYWQREQQHMIRWVKSLPKPVGIFACNDDRGQHILEVCKIINLKVPEDVPVIGVDNDPMICDLSDPPLTSIALNIESAGYEAAALMDSMIKKKKPLEKQIIVSPTQIVQRQSSNILAVDDNDVAIAIRYIMENAKNKILINDIVSITNSGRRKLEKQFRKMIHRSIYQEIRQIRVELISKMLLETEMSVSQIASLFTFTDAEHISRYFKKAKGKGLREFRKLYHPH